MIWPVIVLFRNGSRRESWLTYKCLIILQTKIVKDISYGDVIVYIVVHNNVLTYNSQTDMLCLELDPSHFACYKYVLDLRRGCRLV